MKTISGVVLAVALLLTSAACGGGSDSDSDDQAETTQEAPTEEEAPEEPGDPMGPAEGLQRNPLGQQFIGLDDEDEGYQEGITVTKVTCGLEELEGAADNPDWDGSEDVPETATATPESGMEFCTVDATIENLGTVPIQGWTDFADFLTTDAAYAATSDLDTYTQNLSEAAGGYGPYLAQPLNPGSSYDVVKVYQVPAGSEPLGASWPVANIDSEPYVVFLVE